MYVAAFMRKEEREFLSETERDVLRDRRGHPDFGEVQPAGFFKTDLELLLKVGKVCGQIGGVKMAGRRHVPSWRPEFYRAVLIHRANQPVSKKTVTERRLAEQSCLPSFANGVLDVRQFRATAYNQVAEALSDRPLSFNGLPVHLVVRYVGQQVIGVAIDVV